MRLVCCVCVGCACRGRRAVCVCRVVSWCGGCRGTRDVADVGGVWGSANWLRAEGAAAVASAVSKLVNLTSLDLHCTWSGWCCVWVWVWVCVCVCLCLCLCLCVSVCLCLCLFLCLCLCVSVSLCLCVSSASVVIIIITACVSSTNYIDIDTSHGSPGFLRRVLVMTRFDCS